MLINPLRQRAMSWREQEIMFMPLGLGYIASVLMQAGHAVKIIERRFFYKADYWNDEIMEAVDLATKGEIVDFSPDVVGVTASTPLIMDAFRTVRLAKEINPTILTVIGGCHPTAYPELTLRQCPDLDIVCRGEGENTSLEMANGVPFDRIGGITYRKNGSIFSNPNRQFVENLDIFPYPARELFDTDFYFLPSRAIMKGIYARSATVYTARGCPFTCTFCQSPQLATAGVGKYFRVHSPEYIVKEIGYLHETYGVEGVMILDDMFSLDKKRALAICEELISSGLSKRIKYIVQTRIDSVDDVMMQALKDSGCFQLLFGCESGSDATLKRMQKRITAQENLNAVRLAHKYKINCSANILIGTPGETEEDFRKTIVFLKASRPDWINVSKFYPLPGSQDYLNLAKGGILKDEYANWDEIYEQHVAGDFTFAAISSERFRRLINKMNREIYLYTDYLFELKNNIRRDMGVAAKKMIFICLHISFLYLPMVLQDTLKRIIATLSYRMRHIFYDAVAK